MIRLSSTYVVLYSLYYMRHLCLLSCTEISSFYKTSQQQQQQQQQEDQQQQQQQQQQLLNL